MAENQTTAAPQAAAAEPSITGRVTRIQGSVIDVEFPVGHLPDIYNALKVNINNVGSTEGETLHEITLEVEQHLGDSTVRTVALKPTDGLVRGATVTDTGGPIKVPVGDVTKGHVFDVSGNIYAAYVDTEGKANDPSDLVNMSIAGARYAADADNKGGVIVTTTLGIDKTVKVSNSGVLDVSGQLSMPESTISNSGVVSIVGEDGFIQVNTAINNDVNGVMYQTREGAAPGTPYVNYASFANAVAVAAYNWPPL